MNNKDIETLSVNAVRECITITDHLEQSISDNDKEPSWDGSIIIYGDKKGDKSKFLGKVPVQVKGKRESKQSKNEISYKMKVSDLRNYLIDGGCFLFMVYINPNNMKKKIYYNALTPIKLEKILENVVKQKTKSIRLKNFPLDNNKKENILLNFHNDCTRQTSFKRIDYIEIEEIGKIKSIEEIIIPFASITKPVSYKMLLENEVYIYARLHNNSTLIPVNALPKVNTISNYIDCNISVDDKAYYDKMRIIRKIDGFTLCIGESLKLIFKDNEDEFKINYKSSSKARVLAKDLEFNIKILEAGYFRINDEIIEIDRKKLSYTNFDLDQMKQKLEFTKDVVKTLDILGCKEDINFNELEKQDLKHLNVLISAFVYDRNIVINEDTGNSLRYVSVGNLKFLLFFEELEANNKFKLNNFFDVHLYSKHIEEDKETKYYDVSQFLTLSTNDILTLNNIDFTKIILDFKEINHNKYTFPSANSFLIELLLALDKANGVRKEEIADTCVELAQWIRTSPDDELEQEIKILNLLQVYKRQRNLTDSEIDELYRIIENKSEDYQSMVGSYLLLDQQRQANRYFMKMSDIDQDNFRKFPIYHFWKNY